MTKYSCICASCHRYLFAILQQLFHQIINNIHRWAHNQTYGWQFFFLFFSLLFFFVLQFYLLYCFSWLLIVLLRLIAFYFALNASTNDCIVLLPGSHLEIQFQFITLFFLFFFSLVFFCWSVLNWNFIYNKMMISHGLHENQTMPSDKMKISKKSQNR